MNNNVNHVITNIYDACLAPNNWQRAMDRFVDFIDAKGAVLLAQDLNNNPFQLQHLSSVHSQEDMQFYLDNLIHHEKEGWEQLTRLPAQTIRTTEQIWPNHQHLKDRPDMIYWKEKVHTFHRWGARLNVNKGWIDSIGVQYSDRVNHISEASLKQAQTFLPHIAKAVEISRTFMILKNHYRAIMSALDHVRIGMCIVTAEGYVEHMNLEAERILNLKDGVTLSLQRNLTSRNSEKTALIAHAIAQISATASGENGSRTIRVDLPRRSGKHAFMLEVAPLRDTSGEISNDYSGALVTLIDPDSPREFNMKRVAKTLGLSSAETTICQGIVNGLSGPEIAEHRSVSYETVKSQIKSIKRKSSVTGRNELIRLILSVDPPVDRPTTK